MSEPAIIRAHAALMELREAMEDVRQTLPTHLPGQGPSAADNCRHLLDFMDHNITLLAMYLGTPTRLYHQTGVASTRKHLDFPPEVW